PWGRRRTDRSAAQAANDGTGQRIARSGADRSAAGSADRTARHGACAWVLATRTRRQGQDHGQDKRRNA
ncbi:MAG TPA: hypothetical protein VE963_11800, partial [Reyranella sp.]|nr:hypothetical protein [Reyranella sp.]